MHANIFNIQKFSLHDGPGIRTVVFFKGCPLRCLWCANPESQSTYTEVLLNKDNTSEIVGESKSIDDILTEIVKDQAFYEESGGGVTLSGGEVLLQTDFATELLSQCRDLGIHTAIETTGYAPLNKFKKLVAYADLLLFDIKHYDSQKHQQYTGVPNELLLSNIEWAIRQNVPVIARIPVIPDINDSLEDARQFCLLLQKLNIIDINLLPFHQFGQQKYEQLGMKYEMIDTAALHPEDLVEYTDIFLQAGFQVK